MTYKELLVERYNPIGQDMTFDELVTLLNQELVKRVPVAEHPRGNMKAILAEKSEQEKGAKYVAALRKSSNRPKGTK